MEAPQDSRSLVAGAQRGEEGSFDALVARYDPRIRALIQSRLGPHLKIEVDDVYQECLLRALRSIGAFQWQGEDSFLRWLGAIAEHVIRDLARRRERSREVALGEPSAADDVSPSRGLRREERFERLERALESLSEDHRTVLRLAHIDGLKTREIAERMDRSPEAVRQLLWRALKQLRGRFDDTRSLRLPPRTLLDETDDGARGDD